MTTLIPKFDLKNGGTTPVGAINRTSYEKLADTVSVKDFGAVGDGITDDRAAIVAAITASKAVYFPAGNYLVSSPITITTSLQGRVLYADGAQDSPTATIYCKDITGYLFNFSVASGSTIIGFTVKGLAFDGSNGAGVYSSGSTTWQGVMSNATGSTAGSGFVAEVFVKDCTISWSQVASAAALNLQAFFFVSVENTRIQGWVNGYAVYIGGAVTDTTISFKKCYFLFCRETVTVLNGNTDIQFYDCVWDSVIIACSIFITKTLFSGCYFENIGYDITGASRTTGITLKRFNVNFGAGVLDTAVNSAINIGYAPALFNSCFFNGYAAGTNGWLYAMGRGSSSGGNGDIRFYSCYGNGQGFLNATDYTAAYTNLVYLGWYNCAITTYSGGIYVNGLTLYDIRLFNDGQINVTFPAYDGAHPTYAPIYQQQVQITNGRWIITNPVSGGGGWSGAPTNNPTGGYWQIGDTIYNSIPAAGGWMGLVCTTAATSGNTGTWKNFGAIAA